MTEPTNPNRYTEGLSAAQISEALANQSSSTPTSTSTDPKPIASTSRTFLGDSPYDDSYHATEDPDTDMASGTMFSGPGHTIEPSSVSRMSFSGMKPGRRSSEWMRRSGSRRMSVDSRVSLQRPGVGERQFSTESSVFARSDYGEDGADAHSGDDDDDDGRDVDAWSSTSRSVRRRRKRSESTSPVPARHSVFENIASLFGGGTQAQTHAQGQEGTSIRSRRPSLSHRSTASSRKPRSRRSSIATSHRSGSGDEDDDDERWGYSSGEEAYSSQDEGGLDRRDGLHDDEDEEGKLLGDDISINSSMLNSQPPSPRNFLPLLPSTDPIFGTSTDTRVEFTPLPFSYDAQQQSGHPSRQEIYLADEDQTIRFVGYEPVRWRVWMWWVGCVVTVGILGLLGRWFPRMWLRWCVRERAFRDVRRGFVVVETSYNDISIHTLHRVPYPHEISTVFPDISSSPTANGYSNGNANGHARSRAPSVSSLSGDAILKELVYVDYRYTRYGLNPRTGLFVMLRDWRDPTATSLSAVQNGLSDVLMLQRRALFGNNEIDIEGKSVGGLLVDEIIHPFYVFQLASIVLWSLDDYYYYAFCIAVISLASIGSALVDTRKTIKRMREMSKFSCGVVVYRDGRWQESTSPTLLPGDIVRLSSNPSDPTTTAAYTTQPLSIIPADMFLLSGDAILNESMLTGESVPVSKVPIKDDVLLRWRNLGNVKGSDVTVHGNANGKGAEGAKGGDVGELGPDGMRGFLYAGTRVVRIRGAPSVGSPGASGEGTGMRPALGLVVRTGFNTTKGALVRSMLFPKPMGFKFYRDSMRFVAFLACVAGLGFCVSAVRFIELGIPAHTILLRALDLITIVVPPALPATLSIGTSFAISRLRNGTKSVFNNTKDANSSSTASTGEHKGGIHCISPSRVNVAGKVNVCCFDKTGTLTEDGLDVLGVRFGVARRPNLGLGLGSPGAEYAYSPAGGPLDPGTTADPALGFGELVEDVEDVPQGIPSSRSRASTSSGGATNNATFLHALATCHSLKLVDGQPIGDPLDMKMFEFTKWTLEEGGNSSASASSGGAGGAGPGPGGGGGGGGAGGGVGVIKGKGGQVVEQTALVQCVVRPPGSAGFRVEDALRGGAKHAHFLELGVIRSFEFVSSLRRMSVIVKRLKSKTMEVYVKGAPEVMGSICVKESFPHDYDDLLSYYTKRGYRVIAIAGKSIEGLTWLKAQKMKREHAESNLHFLGLIIFENKLKPGTTPAVQALRQAHLACRMITGDNPLTAVSVGRECGMIGQTMRVFGAVFEEGNSLTPDSRLEWSCMDDPELKLDPYSLRPLPLSTLPHHPQLGAMAGETEELDYSDYGLVVTGDVFRWMINYAPLETLQRMLVKAHIFARMSPDEKNEIVERLQSLGYTVLMCGDGANDCAALKAADVGISLSEAEASVAAPFTSSSPDIGCVLEVIKEGRAALVTSFSCFKYMALYSMIQFTTITLLYSFASSLGDFQFLYIDLFIIIPVAVTMGRTLPYPQIHHKRPTASLVSKKVLSSIVGQIVITSAVQFVVFAWVRNQEWYLPPRRPNPEAGEDKLIATNYENSVLFLVSCFQYILVAGVFSIGKPYRKAMWTNGWLMASLIVLTLFNVLVLLSPPVSVSSLLELMDLPSSARSFLLLVVVLNVALSSAFEKWGSGWIADMVGVIIKALASSRRRYGGKRRIRDGKAYKAVDNS